MSECFCYLPRMDITVTVDLEEIAREVNEVANDDVETADTIKTWIEHNPSGVKACIINALIDEIAENYS